MATRQTDRYLRADQYAPRGRKNICKSGHLRTVGLGIIRKSDPKFSGKKSPKTDWRITVQTKDLQKILPISAPARQTNSAYKWPENRSGREKQTTGTVSKQSRSNVNAPGIIHRKPIKILGTEFGLACRRKSWTEQFYTLTSTAKVQKAWFELCTTAAYNFQTFCA